MKKTFLAATCVIAVCSSPAFAQHHNGGGGNAFGSAFGGAALGGALGSVLGNALSQPQQPPPAPVYVAPAAPVYLERRVYVAPAPVYVAPAQRVIYHPWPGPGFVCYDPEPSSVTRAICGSQDLSAASLALVQAVYAGIQQAQYNAGAIRAEYASFMQSTRATCAALGFQQQGDCIAGMLSHERDVMVSRLSNVYADEANRPITVNLQLQQRLHDIGLLPGLVDGVYGDGTRRAIATWQSGQGRLATGVLSNEEAALLMPGYQVAAPMPYVQAAPVPNPPGPAPQATPPGQPLMQTASTAPAAQQPPMAQAAVQQVAAQPAAMPQTTAQPVALAPAAPAPEAANDVLGGVRENMPYALARGKLFAAGWQTQFFKSDNLSDQDRDERQWFIDHHISEVEDCSSSGCKMQLHNADGRLLYVYTQSGSHSS
ncbi:MAG TPA: peptidoglycan-binding domain-containing protein, partial [Rhodopila sp.]